MKKTLFLILSFLALETNAQLTASGWTGLGNLGYNSSTPTDLWQATPSPGVYGGGQGLIPVTADAGTTIYQKNTNCNTGACGAILIRINGYWTIIFGAADVFSPFTWLYKYRTLSTSTENHPPCNPTWLEWNGTNTSGSPFSTMFSGNTCIQPLPMISSNLLPNLIQLPNLSTSQINAIPNPQAGMITFDISEFCMKLYDGVVWKCIYPSYGDIVSNDDIALSSGKKLFFNGLNSTSFLSGSQYNLGLTLNNQNILNFTTTELTFNKSIATTGLKTNTTTITGNLTLDANHHKVIFTGSATGSVITLPAANANLGREYIIINHGDINVGVSPNYTIASGMLNSVAAGAI
jgi:hypothetical protein